MKKLLLDKYMMLALLMVLIIIGGTFAFWQWTSQDTTNVAVTVDAVKVLYVKGPNITDAVLKPTTTKEQGISKDIIVSLDKTAQTPVTLKFYLDINALPDGLKDASFKWELYKNEIKINENNFASVNAGDTLNISAEQYITTAKDTYKLYIWIDGNMENPSSQQNQAFSFALKADGYGAVYEETEEETPVECFEFDQETKTITRYYYNESDDAENSLCPNKIIIPSKINDVNVIAIGDSIAGDRGLTGLSFAKDSILESIGMGAFSNNKLSGTLTIPKSVKTIGTYAFRGTDFLESNAFTSIVFESGSVLESIGAGAFANNKIRSPLNIPSSVKTIEGEAFAKNKLSGTLTIPKSVKTIDYSAFNGGYNPMTSENTNQIEKVVFESGITIEEIGETAFGNNKLTGTLIIPKSVKTIGTSAFIGYYNPMTSEYSNSIEKIVCESGCVLENIGSNAFENNKLSGTLTIPKSVKTIGAYAFHGGHEAQANEITNVVFESGSVLENIGANAFGNNKLSGTITIPKSVKTIGESAFAGWGERKTNALTNVIFESGSVLETIGDSVFYNNNLSGTLTIPRTVKTIGMSAFQGDDSPEKPGNTIENIVFESNSMLESIGMSAFSNNKLSGTITIPKSVKTIGIAAFCGSENGITNRLTAVVFESGSVLETISGGSFEHNKLSGTLTIPKSVKTIEQEAFSGDEDGSGNMITNVIFESGSVLNKIGAQVFAYNNLSSFTIPSAVKSITLYALKKNPNLTTIVNTTGLSFKWCGSEAAIDYLDCTPYNSSFKTGTVTYNGKTISITAS